MNRFVFHCKRGGSGKIRGTQIAQYLGARLNSGETCPDDVHIWVKQQPPNPLPKNSYLDVLDAHRRVGWLLKHPECGVIASSTSGHKYLKERLDREDVHLIPQHHCNFNRVRRNRDGIKVAGVVGGLGSIQCDLEQLYRILDELGLSFRWLQRYRGPNEITKFYEGLDVQIVWRKQDRPLKNPLKIVNAMSLGIPTIGYSEIAYQELDDYYWSIKDLAELPAAIERLGRGFDVERLIARAEDYHIENIAPLYGALL